MPFYFDKILIQSVADVYCWQGISCKVVGIVPIVSSDVPSRRLTTVELNAITYTSGYVIHKLQKQHEYDRDVSGALTDLLEG